MQGLCLATPSQGDFAGEVSSQYSEWSAVTVVALVEMLHLALVQGSAQAKIQTALVIALPQIEWWRGKAGTAAPVEEQDCERCSIMMS